MLNGIIHPPEDTLYLPDIGSQPDDRRYPGSTLICVTTNINTACCRENDNNGMTNATAGAVGEWYYPNGTLVPSPRKNEDFIRVRYLHQVRLARELFDLPPLGVYTCQVPEISTGILYNASITILQSGKQN